MPKCKKVFKESKEVPSPPFTRNSLIIKRIAKKVKGEGLKTLFYIYARVKEKSIFHLAGFSVFPKIL